MKVSTLIFISILHYSFAQPQTLRSITCVSVGQDCTPPTEEYHPFCSKCYEMDCDSLDTSEEVCSCYSKRTNCLLNLNNALCPTIDTHQKCTEYFSDTNNT